MDHSKLIENWLPQLTESIELRRTANNRSATRLGEFEMLHMANIADCYALLSDEEARKQACAISNAIHLFYRHEISIELAVERLDSVWDSSGPDEHHTMLRLIAQHSIASLGFLDLCRKGATGLVWGDPAVWAGEIAHVHSFRDATGEPDWRECSPEFAVLDDVVCNPEYVVQLYRLGWILADSCSSESVLAFTTTERMQFRHGIEVAMKRSNATGSLSW